MTVRAMLLLGSRAASVAASAMLARRKMLILYASERTEANLRRGHLFLFSMTLLALTVPISALAQQWSGIVDPARAVNWSNVGVPGGIPARTTICTTLNPGATSAQINSAIQNCPSGQTVFLSSGTYNLSQGITFSGKSNVTLRGAGADQTLIVFSGSGNSCSGQNADICMPSTDVNYWGGPSNTANWTAGYAKGTTIITLSGTSNLRVGNPLILDQSDDATDPGTIFVCQSTSCTEEGTGGASRPNRGQVQIVTVTAISGNQITISPGLYMPNWRSGQSPGAWWATNPILNDGVENMSLDHSAASGTLGGIMMFNCGECWVKGIRSVNAGRSHTWLWTSPHATIRDSYFYGTRNAASESYGFESFLSSDTLVENNIYQRISSPRAINGACSGCVISYNLSINNFYSPSASWQQPSEQIHSIEDNMLFEANVGEGIYADNFHGTHHFDTFFRNRYDGFEANNGTTTTANTSPAILYPYTRYYNVIGNVLGSTGRPHTVYQVVAPGHSGNADQAIYQIGTGIDTGDATPDDVHSVTSLMRWGNYDVANNAVRFVSSEVPSGLSQFANPVPGSQALPASFYYASKPSWWPSGKAWPPIGPDVTGGNIPNVGGFANTIPSQDCYTNVMGGPANGTGSVLSFSASKCYTSSSSSSVNPPTGLKAVVQ
jgi:hypothetical protein